MNDQLVGYWPQSIFTYLASSATELDWGGEIYDSKPGGLHTKTQMGSGHFPNEGYGKASYFQNIQYVDSKGNFIDAEVERLVPDATKPSCYNIDVQNDRSGGSGTHFYFGGPGYSEDKNHIINLSKQRSHKKYDTYLKIKMSIFKFYW